MSERSYEGGDGSSRKKPDNQAEQPEAKPPEIRMHDSGGDDGKAQSGHQDAAPEKIASSRQFRDSNAETLDEAMTFKKLDRGNSGQPRADSASQGTGKSFFSQLRNSLLGDSNNEPLAFTRFGKGSDRSGGPRPVERGATAEKKPYDNPFHREPRPETHDISQTQRDHSKKTTENTTHADTIQRDQKERNKEQLSDDTLSRHAAGRQGPKDTTEVDAVYVGLTSAPDKIPNKDAGDAQVNRQRRPEQKESNPSQQLNSPEQAERQIHERQEYVVGYGYDQKQPAMGEVNRLLEGLKAEMGDLLFDPRAVLRVETWASRPGSDSYNLSLTKERAEVLRDLLREGGVTGRIVVAPMGEVRPPTAMALDARTSPDRQSRTGRDNAQDNSADRVAYVTNITPIPPPIGFEGDVLRVPSTREGQQRELDQSVRLGGESFKAIAKTAELAREIYRVPANPFGEDPSADPKEFAKQVGEKVVEGAKALLSGPEAPIKVAKILAKYTLGDLAEIGRGKLKEEVAEKRRPLYDAFADGVAGALDPTFVRTKFTDANQQKMSNSAYEAISRLSDSDKSNVTKYLVADGHSREDSSFGETIDNEWVMNHLTDQNAGENIKYYAHIWFSRDHYLRE